MLISLDTPDETIGTMAWQCFLQELKYNKVPEYQSQYFTSGQGCQHATDRLCFPKCRHCSLRGKIMFPEDVFLTASRSGVLYCTPVSFVLRNQTKLTHVNRWKLTYPYQLFLSPATDAPNLSQLLGWLEMPQSAFAPLCQHQQGSVVHDVWYSYLHRVGYILLMVTQTNKGIKN